MIEELDDLYKLQYGEGSTILIAMCRRGHRDFMWTVERFGLTVAGNEVMRAAFSGNDVKIARWALDHASGNTRREVVEAIINAHCDGRSDMIDFLESYGDIFPKEIWGPWLGRYALQDVCASGNVYYARRLVKRYKFNISFNGNASRAVFAAFRDACRDNHHSMARWLTKRFSLLYRGAHKKIFKSHDDSWCRSLKMARWVVGRVRIDEEMARTGMRRAIQNDRHDVALWLAKCFELEAQWKIEAQCRYENMIKEEEIRLRRIKELMKEHHGCQKMKDALKSALDEWAKS
jgi:hypothetical protein